MSAAAQNARRDQLILENLPLVTAIAGNVQRSLTVHTELDDLIHAGTMGLVEAATKYRDDKAVPFAVYAKHRIRGAILDSLRQIDWASRDARRHYKQMQTVSRDLTSRLQRNPTQAEIAEAMGLDARKFATLMADFRTLGLSAVRQTGFENQDLPAREVPGRETDGPDSVFARMELRGRLASALQTLPRRHRQVVQLYYEGDMTMKEIGSVLGVNESRVSQIHKSALAKMQLYFGGNGITSPAALC